MEPSLCFALSSFFFFFFGVAWLSRARWGKNGKEGEEAEGSMRREECDYCQMPKCGAENGKRGMGGGRDRWWWGGCVAEEGKRPRPVPTWGNGNQVFFFYFRPSPHHNQVYFF